jgi:hypothetical protein
MQQIAARPDAKKGSKPGLMAFRIDELDLKMDRVYYKDYSIGLIPYIRQYKLNIHEGFSDITSPDAVVHLIVLKAAQGSGLSSILKLDISGMRNSVGDTLYTARSLAKKTVGAVIRFPFGSAEKK